MESFRHYCLKKYGYQDCMFTLSVASRPVLRNPSSLVTSLTRKVSSKEATLLNSFCPGTNHLMSRLLRSEETPQSSRGNSDLVVIV